MIIHDVEQHSDGWYQIRLGRATASELGSICTTKGEPSKSMDKFALVKAAEILAGRNLNSFSNYAMDHGTKTEPEARKLYCFETDNDVEEVGFCTTDDGSLGCSPDGFVVGGKAGVEIKCPVKPEIHMARIIGSEVVPTEALLQVQGSLLVTGFDWWDYFSYYRDLPSFRVRVYPDLDLHKKITEHVDTFNKMVAKVVDQIKIKYSIGD